jgi:hypothetical protein
MNCLLFASPRAAFEHVLSRNPQVLAIGESHALKGTAVASTTKRFTDQLLPMLGGRASDLVVELLVPDPKCKKAVAKTEQVTKEVTKTQRKTNKNEYVLMAERANGLKIRPHVLRPSCEDYDRIAKAGSTDIVEMLTLIARLTYEMSVRILKRNEGASIDKMVVDYGGALHNDLKPRKGREQWSFGPSLQKYTQQRYVALDLVVREFIKDNDAWRALEWYPHFDAKAHSQSTMLYAPREGSYVLIFPASAPVAEAAAK